MFLSLRYVKSPLLVFITLGVLIFACHGLSLKAQFMIDDLSYVYPDQKLSVYKNLNDYFLKTEGHHYNPLDVLLNVNLFRYFPLPWELYAINLLFFWANAFLLFLFVSRISSDQNLGFLTAVLFSCHPVNAEILCHITLSTVLICTACLQMAMLKFWDQNNKLSKNQTWCISGIFLYIAALLLLEISFSFPIILILLGVFLFTGEKAKYFKSTIPFWALIAVYCAIWFIMASKTSAWETKIHHLNISFFVFTASLTKLLTWYLSNLLNPVDLVIIRNIQPLKEFIPAWNFALALGLVFISVFYILIKDNLKKFALSWFLTGFLFLLPAAPIHAYSMGLVIEPNWFYFSSMGFFMFLAILARDLRKHIRLVIYSVLILTLTGTWGVLSYRHHVMAKTEIGYLEYWLKNNPQNLLAAIKLGYQYGYLKSLSVNLDLIDEMDNQVENFIIMKDFKAAQALAGKLLISDPLNPRKKEWLIRLMALNLKTHVISEAQLREYVSLNADKRDLLWLIKELDRLELRKTALEITAKGLELFDGDPDFIYVQAVLWANDNNFEEALNLLKTRPDLLKNQIRFEKLSRDIDAARAQGEKKRIPPQK